MASDVRELLCMICGCDYPVWFAPNELWNRVCRLPDGSDRWPFLCPTCFGMKAVEAGETPPFIFAEGTVAVGSHAYAELVTAENARLRTEVASLRSRLVEPDEPLACDATLRDLFAAHALAGAVAATQGMGTMGDGVRGAFWAVWAEAAYDAADAMMAARSTDRPGGTPDGARILPSPPHEQPAVVPAEPSPEDALERARRTIGAPDG